ncbi:hypothetical protein [Bacillus atrophaeus]|uniref:hypothetical protein n=1 Tax=Bacillus atrophaeus TaxID=1452 RepID=UPI00227EE21C|nr:hypothetical protein [Bacillus atrophaeus]MCY9204750.1 hypothetical protein [Bacillus atrophaeus]MEC0885960.1 hypothetical protein [Bacillus atrophaeus]
MENPEPNQDSGFFIFFAVDWGDIMYQTIKVGDWVIEADMEETRKQYEKAIDDMCGCGNCLNFYAAVNELPF